MMLALVATGTRPFKLCFMYSCPSDNVIKLLCHLNMLSQLNRVCSMEWEGNCELRM
jgi:hypothetical protein